MSTARQIGGHTLMDDKIFKQVGKNIQNILSSQGKTQQYLAESIGVSKQVMNKIVLGLKAINVVEIDKIANALNVPVEQLLTFDITPEPTHNFSFMGKVKNEKTRAKIELLKTVIDEILMLEEYANEE